MMTRVLLQVSALHPNNMMNEDENYEMNIDKTLAWNKENTIATQICIWSNTNVGIVMKQI